jgi:hypothetical protein
MNKFLLYATAEFKGMFNLIFLVFLVSFFFLRFINSKGIASIPQLLARRIQFNQLFH